MREERLGRLSKEDAFEKEITGKSVEEKFVRFCIIFLYMIAARELRITITVMGMTQLRCKS